MQLGCLYCGGQAATPASSHAACRNAHPHPPTRPHPRPPREVDGDDAEVPRGPIDSGLGVRIQVGLAPRLRASLIACMQAPRLWPGCT